MTGWASLISVVLILLSESYTQLALVARLGTAFGSFAVTKAG